MDWYYEQGGTRVGPVRREDFNRLVGEGKIVPETMVWREGMPEWQPWRSVVPPKRVTAMCCQCGREFLAEEMIRYSNWQVCAACKPVFFQRVKEGCPPPSRDAGEGAGEELNPWFSIWLRPRATMQQIVDSDPRRLVLLLAAVHGFSQTLDRASMRNLGDKLSVPVILAIALVAGPLVGWFGLYLGGVLMRWTGKWIGGRAPAEHIRSVLAWSGVPLVWALLLLPIQLALFGREMFTTETPVMDASLPLTISFWTLAAVELAIGVWAAIVELHCLGQVQGFSAWRALGNILLTGAVVAVPILCIIAVGVALAAAGR